MNTRRGSFGRAAWLAIVLPALLLCPQRSRGQSAGDESNRFYVVVSRRLLTDVSENDAKAAVRAWAEAIARERNLRAEPEPVVADGPAALALAWKNDRADVLAITTDEYLAAGIPARHARFMAEVSGGSSRVEYLLLVHQGSGIRDLAGAAGHRLMVFENSRTSLALPWLDSVLLDRGLPPADVHFGLVQREKRLSATVLPVFFQQREACLVSRRGFEVICELNPQIGRQLKIVEASPEMLPSFSVIRTGVRDLGQRIDLATEVLRLQGTPAGRQILNIFQSDSMVAVSETDVEAAAEFLRRHDRMLAKWKASPAGRRAMARPDVEPGRSAPAIASEGGGR